MSENWIKTLSVNQIPDEVLKHIYSVDYKSIIKDIMKKFGLDEYGDAAF